ncbi:MAG: hypothetical protein KDE31_06740, partial [Caldilineaceae bacterium]|nr:hypothetical protein [Caldilineaceae bacterium]
PEYKVYLPLIMKESEYKTYLPLVMSAPNPPEAPVHKLFFPLILNGAPGPTTFRIEHVRLWSAAENGASAASPCRESHYIRVYILDSNGDAGIHSRLKQVAVEVSHVKGDLNFTQTILTGEQPLPTPGVAEFVLYDAAKVRIVTDVDGKMVISDAVVVTTDPAHIAQEQLIRAGLCHTPEECQRFVAARTCKGFYS